MRQKPRLRQTLTRIVMASVLQGCVHCCSCCAPASSSPWSYIGPGGSGNFNGVLYSPDGQHLFVGSDVAGLLHGQHDGTAWRFQNISADDATLGLASATIFRMVFIDGPGGHPQMLMGTSDGIYRSNESAVYDFDSWTYITNAFPVPEDSNNAFVGHRRPIHAIATLPDQPKAVLAGVGYFTQPVGSPFDVTPITDRIWRSADRGETWSPATVPTHLVEPNWQVYDIAPSPTSAVVLATTTSGLLRSSDSGEHWAWVAVGDMPYPSLRDAVFDEGGAAYVSVWDTEVADCTQPDTDTDEPDGEVVLVGVQGDSPRYIGGPWRSLDQGQTWTQVFPSSTPVVKACRIGEMVGGTTQQFPHIIPAPSPIATNQELLLSSGANGTYRGIYRFQQGTLTPVLSQFEHGGNYAGPFPGGLFHPNDMVARPGTPWSPIPEVTFTWMTGGAIARPNNTTCADATAPVCYERLTHEQVGEGNGTDASDTDGDWWRSSGLDDMMILDIAQTPNQPGRLFVADLDLGLTEGRLAGDSVYEWRNALSEYAVPDQGRALPSILDLEVIGEDIYALHARPRPEGVPQVWALIRGRVTGSGERTWCAVYSVPGFLPGKCENHSNSSDFDVIEVTGFAADPTPGGGALLTGYDPVANETRVHSANQDLSAWTSIDLQAPGTPLDPVVDPSNPRWAFVVTTNAELRWGEGTTTPAKPLHVIRLADGAHKTIHVCIDTVVATTLSAHWNGTTFDLLVGAHTNGYTSIGHAVFDPDDFDVETASTQCSGANLSMVVSHPDQQNLSRLGEDDHSLQARSISGFSWSDDHTVYATMSGPTAMTDFEIPSYLFRSDDGGDTWSPDEAFAAGLPTRHLTLQREGDTWYALTAASLFRRAAE